jgi:Kef-type K+ transport system membrane component KefB
MKHEVIVIILVMVFVSAWITEVIGVHAIFGAFLLGVVTPRVNGFAIRLTERIEVLHHDTTHDTTLTAHDTHTLTIVVQDVVIIILLPLYFTYSGLRTNLESLDSWQGTR